MPYEENDKKIQEKSGCLFLGLSGISIWVWIILACVKIKFCICGLIGALVSAIIFRVFRKRSINYRSVIASVFGVVFSTIIAVCLGMGVISGILLSVGLNMVVISVYNIIYEIRK